MLYIVGTPIGNLSDFSSRGKEILSQVDWIACEDTRVTGLLLQAFDIKQKLISYHEHNKHFRTTHLLHLLESGQKIALVSDAGMPIISDPGQELVQACRQKSIPVSIVPGPCAVISALCLSGFEANIFTFAGFLSTDKKVRGKAISDLAKVCHTIILYEAPHRLVKTLIDLQASTLKQRRFLFARELTKKYEEVLEFSLLEAIDYYQKHSPRGEFVVVIKSLDLSKKKEKTENDTPYFSQEEDFSVSDLSSKENLETNISLEEAILGLIKQGYSTKEISKILALIYQLPAKVIYNHIVRLL